MFLAFAIDHPFMAMLLIDIAGGMIGYFTVRIFMHFKNR